MLLTRLYAIALCGMSIALSSACATAPDRSHSSLTVVVGPVIFEAPATKSTQIHTFEEAPDKEADRLVLPVLISEVELTAQRLFTEHLSQQPRIRVIPFDETRRLLADIAPAGTPLTEEQVQHLGEQTGADHVVTGLIHDYGAVRWQYWVTGLTLHAATEALIIGFASGWNPAIVVPAVLIDIATDIPIWYGGAEIFGWAFRPVRVHMNISQVRPCAGPIWSRDELVVRVPGKQLERYSKEQKGRKEIQLEANLHKAAEELSSEASDVLEIQPCEADGTATPNRTFSWARIFDWVL